MSSSRNLLWSAALLLGLAGCSAGTGAPEAGNASVTPRMAERLFDKVPGSSASDYRATRPTYRLLGVQPGDGQNGFATLMDTHTFVTRNVPVGGTVSRSVVLRSLGGNTATFDSSVDGARVVPVGGTLTTLQVEHRFDRTTEELGKHRFRVDTATAREVDRRFGLGGAAEPVQLFGQQGLRLTRVDRDGLLARLGFAPGDVLLTPLPLDALVHTLAAPPSAGAAVRVVRGGNLLDRTYKPG